MDLTKPKQKNSKSKSARINYNAGLLVAISGYRQAAKPILNYLPWAMYRASPRFLIGPGFTYIFRKSNYYNYQTSYYGPRAIASYSLFKDFGEVININIGDIILHSEYELLSVEKLYLDPNNTVIKDGRALINSLLVGGGIFQPIGQRGGLSIMLLYNLIESDFSPYTNPVIRFGFYF